MYIIEYIGKGGIRHTEYDGSRANTPRPGDVIDFGENKGTYPFTEGKYGRVESINFCDTGLIHICCELGSVFLSDGHVSISGGPFTTVLPEELSITFKTKVVHFWNWGNNSPGGGKGVDYYINRPVFLLDLRTEEVKAKVEKSFSGGE